LTQRGQREVRWSSTYLRKEEQGQRLTAATTHGSAKIGGAEEVKVARGWGGGAWGKDHIALRTSKQSRRKQREEAG